MVDRKMMDPAPVDVGARFSHRHDAEAALKQLEEQAGVAPAQVEIVSGDGRLRRARSLESRGARTALVRWHAILGLLGLALGVLLWIFARYAAVPVFLALPTLMLFVSAAFGAVAGLFIGGLLSIRPGKGWLATAVRDDARAGHYPVVVHATSLNQAREVQDVLVRAKGDPYLGGLPT